MLYLIMVWTLYHYWNPVNSYTSWTMPFPPHWHIGGVFLIDVGALVLGIVLMLLYARRRPAFFEGRTLNKSTKTLVPADLGTEVGLFGIREPDDVPTP